MKRSSTTPAGTYRDSMGRLLALYTQVDRLIMEVCAERVPHAPGDDAQLGLAKQVGDEARHVFIQREWMKNFGTDASPVIASDDEEAIRAHFRSLDWVDFLVDMYLCVEALGTQAVEQIVPLADPGTRESLRIPLRDEVDHVAFGMDQLTRQLARMPESRRRALLDALPARCERLADEMHAMCGDLPSLFAGVGADYARVRAEVVTRRSELVTRLSTRSAA